MADRCSRRRNCNYLHRHPLLKGKRMSRYINQDTEEFIKGTYRGTEVYLVAEEDIEYLENLLENFPLDAEDREIINKALGREEE